MSSFLLSPEAYLWQDVPPDKDCSGDREHLVFNTSEENDLDIDIPSKAIDFKLINTIFGFTKVLRMARYKTYEVDSELHWCV